MTDIYLGAEYTYHGKGGFGSRDVRVRVTGFKKGLVETIGIEDRRYRAVPKSRLSEIG